MNKSRIILALIVGLALLSVTPSFAFRSLEADIPFSFVAGNTSYPAGMYSMRWVDPSNENTLEIRAKDSDIHGVVSVEYGPGLAKTSNRSFLSFAKVGDTRYLQKIETMGEREIAEVPLTAAVRKSMELNDLEHELVEPLAPSTSLD